MTSFDQFLALKGLFLKDLVATLEGTGLLVDELKLVLNSEIANTTVTTTANKSEKKREKKPPNQTQARVGACFRLLVERTPDVRPKVRLGAASKMARFLKERGCVVLDDQTDARLVDEAVSYVIDPPSSSSHSLLVSKDNKPGVLKTKTNKDRTKSKREEEKETLKRLEEIEKRARAEQESDEEESSDEDDDDDSCPPEEALELVSDSGSEEATDY